MAEEKSDNVQCEIPSIVKYGRKGKKITKSDQTINAFWKKPTHPRLPRVVEREKEYDNIKFSGCPIYTVGNEPNEHEETEEINEEEDEEYDFIEEPQNTDDDPASTESETSSTISRGSNDDKKTHRSYCFTINNPETKTLSFPPIVRYAVWQLEQGNEGTFHLQGYMELSKPSRFLPIIESMKELNGIGHFHMKHRIATRDQAREYCMKKDETYREGPWEFGKFEKGGQGTRNDLIAIYDEIKSGASRSSIIDSFPSEYIRYHNGIDKVLADRSKPRDWKPVVIVIYGEPGCGKTRLAKRICGKNMYLFNSANEPWWNNYIGQQCVLFDDFDPIDIKYNRMKHYLDRHEMLIQTKGGMVQFSPKIIVITSNDSPDEWYDRFTALERRISIVLTMDVPKGKSGTGNNEPSLKREIFTKTRKSDFKFKKEIQADNDTDWSSSLSPYTVGELTAFINSELEKSINEIDTPLSLNL
nr:putative replication associated protein [Crucivirus sp.]